MEKLDPRVRQVLVFLRDNPNVIVDGESGYCNVCDNRAHNWKIEHDKQCITTIAKEVLEEEEFDKETAGW